MIVSENQRNILVELLMLAFSILGDCLHNSGKTEEKKIRKVKALCERWLKEPDPA